MISKVNRADGVAPRRARKSRPGEIVALRASDVVLAPHIKSATLPGQPIKRVLFQMAIGDQSVANPSTTSLIHAANLTAQVSLPVRYRQVHRPYFAR
jgi:hypothetical protein